MHQVHCFHWIMRIMHSDLRSLDLNLLVALDALLRRRSVIAAADDWP